MREVFAFEIQVRAACVLGQTRNVKERRRATGIIAQERGEFRLKLWIVARNMVSLRQLFERSHQSLRHEASAIRPPVPARVRLCCFNAAHLNSSSGSGRTEPPRL